MISCSTTRSCRCIPLVARPFFSQPDASLSDESHELSVTTVCVVLSENVSSSFPMKPAKLESFWARAAIRFSPARISLVTSTTSGISHLSLRETSLPFMNTTT